MDYRELLQRYVGRVVSVVVLGQNRVTGRLASVGEDCIRLIDTLSVSELEDSQWMAQSYNDPDATFGARQPESLVHLHHIMVITCLDDTLSRTIDAPAIQAKPNSLRALASASSLPPVTATIVSEAPPAEATWPDDRLCLWLGTGLLKLANGPESPILTAIGGARRAFGAQTGMTLPLVRVRDCLSLPVDGYRVTLDNVEIARATLPSGKLLAIGANGLVPVVDGDDAIDPSFGLPARWISPDKETRAVEVGLFVARPEAVVVTHLQTAVLRHARRFLTLDVIRGWLAKAHETSPALVEELSPVRLPLARLRDVLAELASEGLSLRPIEPILESVASRMQTATGPDDLLSEVRVDLGGALIDRLRSADGSIPLFTLGVDDADALSGRIREEEGWDEFVGDPASDKELERIVANVRRFMAHNVPADRRPALAVPRAARRLMRALIEPIAPSLMVLAYEEIPKEATVQFLGDTGDAPRRTARRKPASEAKPLARPAAKPSTKKSPGAADSIASKGRGGKSPR